MLNNSSRTIKLSFTLRKVALLVVYTAALWCLSLHDAKAAVPTDSTFSVESFRQLPTDVSAFIDAVRDLNDEACALLKVVAPADFAPRPDAKAGGWPPAVGSR